LLGFYSNRTKPIQQAVCDRGYVGVKEVLGATIILPKKALKRDNRYQRDKKRKLCKRRAAIAPIIGHLKSDFRLSRNLLKGQVGDEINVLMAACAWNLRKWLIATVIFFVLAKSWVVYGKKSLFFLLHSVKYCQSKYSAIVLNV
jgi:IS5 family transposase